MSYARAYNPTLHFEDDNGHPLVNGWLYTYLAGTNTPVATAANESGSSMNPVQIRLDSRGECEAWLNPSLKYKFVIYNSDRTWNQTRDNVFVAVGGTEYSGDVSDAHVSFTKNESDPSEISSGSTLRVLFTKVSSFFASLKRVAFTGSYSDLDDTPTIPDVSGKQNVDGSNATMLGVDAMLGKLAPTVSPTVSDESVVAFKSEDTTSYVWSKLKFSSFWNYIKDKISSVLGLDVNSYGGKSETAKDADYAEKIGSTSSPTSLGDKCYPVYVNDGTLIKCDSVASVEFTRTSGNLTVNSSGDLETPQIDVNSPSTDFTFIGYIIELFFDLDTVQVQDVEWIEVTPFHNTSQIATYDTACCFVRLSNHSIGRAYITRLTNLSNATTSIKVRISRTGTPFASGTTGSVDVHVTAIAYHKSLS